MSGFPERVQEYQRILRENMPRMREWQRERTAILWEERPTPAEIEAARENEPDDRERQGRERYEAL